MKATVLSCTLKASPARSNSELLADEVIAGLQSNGVECETVRLVDLNILPGVSSDEGGGDDWPGVREKILASDIIIFASPTWLGKISSVAQLTGNEDGAKNCISELASAAVELGFCVPPLERVMNSIRNGLGMRETEIAREPS